MQDIAHSHLPLKCLQHSENESGSKAGQFGCGGNLDVFMNLVVENAVNYKLQTNPYTIHSSMSTVIHIYLPRKKYVFPYVTRKKLSKNIFYFDFSNITSANTIFDTLNCIAIPMNNCWQVSGSCRVPKTRLLELHG